MENLFDYATKELSQDAFLSWIFANYNDSDLGLIAKKLLIEMIYLHQTKEVLPDNLDNLIVHQQSQDIDIVIDFTLNDEPCILAIEDKVKSEEHGEQLERYKKIIEKWNKNDERFNNRKIFLVYYKTNEIDEGERFRVVKAEWKEFPFEKIHSFWKEHLSSKNLIVKQYAEHIEKLWNDSQNIRRPVENNINQWTSYYKRIIVPALQKDLAEKCDLTVSTTRFGYVNLKAFPFGKKDSHYPYIEMRSRDCLNGKFQAKFLMHDVDLDKSGLPIGLKELRDAVSERKDKGIYAVNNSIKHNKQVAHSPRNNPHFVVESDYDFIKLAKEAIEEYLAIVSIWDDKYGR